MCLWRQRRHRAPPSSRYNQPSIFIAFSLRGIPVSHTAAHLISFVKAHKNNRPCFGSLPTSGVFSLDLMIITDPRVILLILGTFLLLVCGSFTRTHTHTNERWTKRENRSIRPLWYIDIERVGGYKGRIKWPEATRNPFDLQIRCSATTPR